MYLTLVGRAPSRDRKADANPRIRVMLVIGNSLIAIIIIIICTRWGAALGDDSYAYIKPARDAIAGKGLEFNPLFPPFLPMILTGLGFIGIEPLIAIRYLNAILFGFTVLMTYLITFELMKSFVFSFLASVAILLSAVLIEVFASAMSEPLYMSLLLGSIYFTLRFWRSEKKIWLIGAAIAAGFATFTRYAGIAIIGTIALFLLVLTGRPLRKRFMDFFTFSAISILPLSVYSIRNLITIGRPIGQNNFSWSLVVDYPIRLFLQNIYDWIVPARLVAGKEDEITFVLLLAITTIIVGYSLVYRRRFLNLVKRIFTSPPYLLLILLIVMNLIILTISRGFFKGGDPFNPRYLSPVLLISFIVFIGVLGKIYFETGTTSKIFVSFVCVGFLALLGLRAGYIIQFLYRQGSGYSSQRWHISETLAYLRRRPDTPVMSTAAPGVYFWTGRLPLNVPNSRADVRDYLCDTGGFLVVIDSMPLEFYGINPKEVTEGLIIEQDFSEGTIYRIDPVECEQ